MKILLSGGTGFIGRELLRQLLKERHYVIVLSRKAHVTFGIENFFVETVWWDGKKIDHTKVDLESLDAIINLSGESIAGKRWSKKQKQNIIDSRIESTRAIIELTEKLTNKPKFLINASAVGYYGDVSDKKIDETNPKGTGFLSDVCEKWENEAKKNVDLGVELTIIRIGVVLGERGGALKKMIPLFRANLGAVLGSGNQGFSWIHLDDLVRAIIFILNKKISGVVNLTSPNPVDNREFSNVLAKTLGKKCMFSVPSIAMKILLGEMSQTLLEGQKVIPQILLNNSFQFRFGEIETALKSIITNNKPE